MDKGRQPPITTCGQLPPNGEPPSYPAIGAHLATLNLFREADGSVHLTVAHGTGAIDEWRDRPELAHANVRPIEYVEALAVEGADNIRKRHELRGLIANPAIQIEAKPHG